MPAVPDGTSETSNTLAGDGNGGFILADVWDTACRIRARYTPWLHRTPPQQALILPARAWSLKPIPCRRRHTYLNNVSIDVEYRSLIVSGHYWTPDS